MSMHELRQAAELTRLEEELDRLRAELEEATALHSRVKGYLSVSLDDSANLRAELTTAQARRKELEEEVKRVKGLYDTWGMEDKPCKKHRRENIFIEDCAVCRAEKAEAALAEVQVKLEKAERFAEESDKSLVNQRRRLGEEFDEVSLELQRVRKAARIEIAEAEKRGMLRAAEIALRGELRFIQSR